MIPPPPFAARFSLSAFRLLLRFTVLRDSLRPATQSRGRNHRAGKAAVPLRELRRAELNNFSRLDAELKARGIRGAAHGAKGEIEVWRDFEDDPEALAFESQRLCLDIVLIGLIGLVEVKALCDSGDMQTIQLEEAQAHLPQFVEDVANGKEVLIARGGRAVAKLVAAGQVTGQPRFGSARGKITFHPGWDEPAPGFEEYQ